MMEMRWFIFDYLYYMLDLRSSSLRAYFEAEISLNSVAIVKKAMEI